MKPFSERERHTHTDTVVVRVQQLFNFYQALKEGVGGRD